MLAKAQRRKMEKMVKENRKQIRGYKGEPLRIGEFVMYKTKPVSLKGHLPGSYGWRIKAISEGLKPTYTIRNVITGQVIEKINKGHLMVVPEAPFPLQEMMNSEPNRLRKLVEKEALECTEDM
eukprot:744456_1